MTAVHMPGCAKHARDLESLKARLYLKLAFHRRIPEVTDLQREITECCCAPDNQTFRQRGQAGISYANLLLSDIRPAPREREQGYRYNPTLNVSLEP